MKFKPQYSDKRSIRFWEVVNSLPAQEQGEMYLAGCLLQNMEGQILDLLNRHVDEYLTENKKEKVIVANQPPLCGKCYKCHHHDVPCN